MGATSAEKVGSAALSTAAAAQATSRIRSFMESSISGWTAEMKPLKRQEAARQLPDQFERRIAVALPTREAAPGEDSPEIGDEVPFLPVLKDYVGFAVRQIDVVDIAADVGFVEIVRRNNVAITARRLLFPIVLDVA